MDQRTQPKNNTTTIIIVVVVILIALGTAGYFLNRYLARKAANALINDLTGGQIQVSDTGLGITAQWPSDLPVSIPKYAKGSVKFVTKLNDPKTWDILIENTTQADFDAYVAELKNQGWTQKSEIQFMASIAQFEKPGWDLTLAFDASSNGAKITLVEAPK